MCLVKTKKPNVNINDEAKNAKGKLLFFGYDFRKRFTSMSLGFSERSGKNRTSISVEGYVKC
ncbi:MAG: hypothetical protein OHK0019_07290 [Saprospiraceae bacterium]